MLTLTCVCLFVCLCFVTSAPVVYINMHILCVSSARTVHITDLRGKSLLVDICNYDSFEEVFSPFTSLCAAVCSQSLSNKMEHSVCVCMSVCVCVCVCVNSTSEQSTAHLHSPRVPIQSVVHLYSPQCTYTILCNVRSIPNHIINHRYDNVISQTNYIAYRTWKRLFSPDRITLPASDWPLHGDVITRIIII